MPTDANFKQWTESDKATVDFLVYNFPSGNPDDYTGDEYFMTYYQVANLSSRTFLPVWKFKDANVYYTELQSDVGTRDIYVFRLAETYLIAAEAVKRLNKSADVLNYFNAIRERAEKIPNSLQYPSGTTVTIDMILDKRALELFGEVSHWNDL